MGERLVLDVKAEVLSVVRGPTTVGCPYDFDFVVLERE